MTVRTAAHPFDVAIDAGMVWFNGRMVDQREATVSVFTHALHYGSSVWEGVRCYATQAGPAMFRLADHLRRLDASARILRIPSPYSVPELAEAAEAVVTLNGYRSCYVRPMLWRGLGTLGINPLPNPVDALVAAWQWAAAASGDRSGAGWRLVTSGWNRPPAAAMPGKAKAAGNYVNSMLARMDALSAGLDNALLLDSQGFVSEGTAENVFFVRDGVLHALDHGVALAGITRDTVLTLARDDGIDVVLCRATREELWSADEVFLTGTAAEVMPVIEIDHRLVGTGAVGPVTTHLHTRYLDVCHGRDVRYESWLHRP